MSGQRRHERPPEVASSPYAALPFSVMDAGVYIALSDAAIRLLLELTRRHDGFNNGALHASFATLAKRGIKSRSKVERAFDELLRSGLIVKTRDASREENEATRYFLTWLPPNQFDRSGKQKDMPLLPRPVPVHKYLTITPVEREINLRGAARKMRAFSLANSIMDEDTDMQRYITGNTASVPPGGTGMSEKMAKPMCPGGTGSPVGQDRPSRPAGHPSPVGRDRGAAFRSQRRFSFSKPSKRIPYRIPIEAGAPVEYVSIN